MLWFTSTKGLEQINPSISGFIRQAVFTTRMALKVNLLYRVWIDPENRSCRLKYPYLGQ
jgi:hypothetical protein